MDKDLELKKIAYHAAGDVVVSFLFGYEATDIQIDYSEKSGPDYSASMEGPGDQYIDAIIYVAGYIAEQIFTDSKEDFDLNELSYYADMPITSEIISSCKKLLIHNWKTVEVLALALFNEKMILGGSATEIIKGALENNSDPK